MRISPMNRAESNPFWRRPSCNGAPGQPKITTAEVAEAGSMRDLRCKAIGAGERFGGPSLGSGVRLLLGGLAQ
jgi:hypothetical protein